MEKNSKIIFSIPDFWYNFKLNTTLLDLMKTEKEKFYDDVVIESVYGSFPCIWNGGRYIGGFVGNHSIENTINSFNERKISVRYTFTNSLIEETDLYDRLCNTILSLTENGMNGVNVNNKLLEDYIRKNYPGFYILYSTTLGISSVEELNKYSENNIIIPDYNVNNKFNILNQLTHPENIEILIGETCVDNCPNRQKHHEYCSSSQLYNFLSNDFKCPAQCSNNYYYYEKIPVRKHYISIDSIREKYLPLGINKFKISGRKDGVVNMVERYVNYLVKPEYKDEVRNKLLVLLIGNGNHIS